MTPDQLTLAKQLAALPGFRWENGMNCCESGKSSGRVINGASWPMRPNWFPDLADAATGGVLLCWLWRLRDWHPHGHESGGPDVTIHDEEGEVVVHGRTLTEACARALIAVGRCA